MFTRNYQNERIDIASDKSKFVEVYIMRVIISIILMVIAALVGFFFGAGMSEAMGGAILLSMITGFALAQLVAQRKQQILLRKGRNWTLKKST